MKGKFIAKCVLMGILGIGFVFALGFVVMSLWNWLMPALFGLKIISYCQAFGLLILAKILFGGFHRRWGRHCGGGGCCHGRNHWKSRWESKWAQMSPEEREKFSKGFGGRCGYSGEGTEGKAE